MDPNSPSLRIAVDRLKGGDLAAFEDVYRDLASPLLAYLRTQIRRREDAEDVLGQVFLEAVRGIRRFRGGPTELRLWLFRIARDRSIDLARRLRRRPEEPLRPDFDRPAEDRPEDEAIARIEQRRVLEAVATLPALQREVLVLRIGSGLSSSEIARVLGKRQGAVKALQHRALANLARRLAVADQAPVPQQGPAAL